MGFGAIRAWPVVFNFDEGDLALEAWAPDRPDVKIRPKTMGQGRMAPNAIVLRYHFGNFVH